MDETRLVAYPELDAHDLAKQQHENVNRNIVLLKERNLWGLIGRYGLNLEVATEMILKGQRDHRDGKIGHYAVIGESGDAEGSASIFPGLPLRKLPMLMPAGVGRKYQRLVTEYPYATPNIHAWTTEEVDLAEVYRQLSMEARRPEYRRWLHDHGLEEPWHNGAIWTLEPSRSPVDIHEAITSFTGLEKVATARFDDGEANGRSIPPRGVLYADLVSHWTTPLGKLWELRTGETRIFGG